MTANHRSPDLNVSTVRGRNRELLRSYQRQWIAGRRRAFFADKACADCGLADGLELDHVDPATKESHKIWSWAPARRIAEIAKCVVRCRSCHAARHSALRRVEHGSAGYKRGCRCEVCYAWKQAAAARERVRRERKSNPSTRLCRPLPNRSAIPPGRETYSIGVRMDRLVMVTRNDDEAEPAVVNTDDPSAIVLVLDDGQTIALDRVELMAALVEREAA